MNENDHGVTMFGPSASARDNAKPNWIFYPAWVALTAISFPIALTIAWAFLSRVVDVVGGSIQVGGQVHITEDFLLVYILIPLLGVLIGFLQYLLLRRYLPRMAWWIAATLLGWLLLLVVLLISATLSAALAGYSMWLGAIETVLIGGSIAVPQWFVLRQRVRRAALWILASLLGWGVAVLIAGATISSVPDVLAVVFLPPAAASVAWWLLLDKLQHRESNGSPQPFVSSGAH